MSNVINVYLDYLMLCVVCIHGRMYVCCSECNVVSNECDEPTSCLVISIGAHDGEVTLGVFALCGYHGFLNCDDICICVVNKQFEHIVFFVNSVYVDLQYDEIPLSTMCSIPLHLIDICFLTVCVCGKYIESRLTCVP